MLFAKWLREGVRRGEITTSIRVWQQPRVKVGACYRMEEGAIQIDAIRPLSFADITPEMARRSGFKGVIDLLKTAKHGRGENVYWIEFHYLPPGRAAGPSAGRLTSARRPRPR
jgi:hypothetical protein